MANITLDSTWTPGTRIAIPDRLYRRLAAIARLNRILRARRAVQRLVRAELGEARDLEDAGLGQRGYARRDSSAALSRALGGF